MMTDQIAEANRLRGAIKAIAVVVDDSMRQLKKDVTEPEAIANIMLAYRHLEGASMRLGKAIQALDGGVSVYDRKTTVGA